MITIRILAAVCASIVICSGATPARGEPFRVGRLSCIGSPRIGKGLGSTQSLRCVFYRRRSSQPYFYEGRIRRVGLDVGVIQAGTLLLGGLCPKLTANSFRLVKGELCGGERQCRIGTGLWSQRSDRRLAQKYCPAAAIGRASDRHQSGGRIDQLDALVGDREITPRVAMMAAALVDGRTVAMACGGGPHKHRNVPPFCSGFRRMSQLGARS